MPDDVRSPERLRAEELERERQQRELAERAERGPEERTARRRAERAAYLAEKLREQVESER